MPLRLLPAGEADAPRAAEVERAAHAPDPFSAVLFPGPSPPGALERRAAALAAELRGDPTVVWRKVVDTDAPDGEQAMIAFAKIHIYERPPGPPPGPGTFGPGCNAEACEYLFGSLARLRAKHTAGMAHVYLHMCYTDPAHQRRGAGTLLVRWAADEAARRRLPAYLLASPAGHRLYLGQGFRDVEAWRLDMARFGAPSPHQGHAMLLEPPAGPPAVEEMKDGEAAPGH